MEKLELYIPKPEDLWFYQKMTSDPETMSYNAGWDVDYAGYHRDTGCIDYPDEALPDWYDEWVGKEPEPDAPSEPDQPSGSTSVLDYEQQVVTLVNAERAKYGLAALTLDETLCGYARVKSQDMHDQGYFSHTSPTYGSPFDMMRAFGVSYRTAGENQLATDGQPLILEL